MKFSSTITVLAFLAASGANAQELVVELSPERQEVALGATPQFELRIRAVERVRVLDLARRGDLRDKLLRPRVSGPDTDDLPVSVSELKPTDERDYLVLEPGNSIAFSYEGQPAVLRVLAAGTYVVRVRYRPDWTSNVVQSNPVTVRVLPKPR
jgi:hypothetical protein